MSVAAQYSQVVFPDGIIPVSDFGTKIMAQAKSAEQALNGKAVGSSISWNDGWVWMVLPVIDGTTKILPVRHGATSGK